MNHQNKTVPIGVTSATLLAAAPYLDYAHERVSLSRNFTIPNGRKDIRALRCCHSAALALVPEGSVNPLSASLNLALSHLDKGLDWLENWSDKVDTYSQALTYNKTPEVEFPLKPLRDLPHRLARCLPLRESESDDVLVLRFERHDYWRKDGEGQRSLLRGFLTYDDLCELSEYGVTNDLLSWMQSNGHEGVLACHTGVTGPQVYITITVEDWIIEQYHDSLSVPEKSCSYEDGPI